MKDITSVPTADRIKAVVQATYNAAADHFNDAPMSFWEHVGSRTVDLAPVREGDSVLDVCCGTGASALPAAMRTGPTGAVLGLDFAERLLDLARTKAARRGLHNVRFERGDLTALDVPPDRYHAVICVAGIFFAIDMVSSTAALWRAVRPGGRLAITTWGARLFEPASTVFWDAVEAVRPELRPATLPQSLIAEPTGLRALFAQAGAGVPEIESETLMHTVSPEQFWTIVLGSGYRLPLDIMDPAEVELVHTRVITQMHDAGLRDLTTDVLYARAFKDPM